MRTSTSSCICDYCTCLLTAAWSRPLSPNTALLTVLITVDLMNILIYNCADNMWLAHCLAGAREGGGPVVLNHITILLCTLVPPVLFLTLCKYSYSSQLLYWWLLQDSPHHFRFGSNPNRHSLALCMTVMYLYYNQYEGLSVVTLYLRAPLACQRRRQTLDKRHRA